MCYAPARRATEFAKRAMQRVEEGKLPEAERLLNAAVKHGGLVMNVRFVDNRRVGDHIEDVRKALLSAQRAQVQR